jgi:hypothetical protein
MDFLNAKRVIKVVYGHSDFESNDNEHRKQLHIMYDGSWDITSRHIIKTLRRVVAAAAPALRVVPHHKWMETSIAFDAFDCPQEHGRGRAVPAGCLPDHHQRQVVPHPD